ncbi:hypothetical protein OROMI_012857 [Orobanche minor]
MGFILVNKRWVANPEKKKGKRNQEDDNPPHNEFFNAPSLPKYNTKPTIKEAYQLGYATARRVNFLTSYNKTLHQCNADLLKLGLKNEARLKVLMEKSEIPEPDMSHIQARVDAFEQNFEAELSVDFFENPERGDESDEGSNEEDDD